MPALNWTGKDADKTPDLHLIEADLVDCMLALSDHFFCSSQIAVCIWFLVISKNADAEYGAFTTAEIQNNAAMATPYSTFQPT